MKINNFALVIGAMKCGTTSLFEYLAQHPQIAPCSHKEPLFFCNSNEWSRGFNYYQSLWKWNSSIHKIALEATASYTRVTHPNKYHMNAAENIAEFQKSTNAIFKFIYIMRNPIDRIESHYTQGRKRKHKDTAQSISKGINREVIDTSKYAMQLDEYYQRFSKDSILLINFEDLKTNPHNLLLKICQFLEVDTDTNWTFENLSTIHNPYSSQVTRISLPGYYFLRETEFVNSILRTIPQQFKSKVISLIELFWSKKFDYEYVKLSSKQRNYVLQELQSDLEKLQNEFGFDINSWSLKN